MTYRNLLIASLVVLAIGLGYKLMGEKERPASLPLSSTPEVLVATAPSTTEPLSNEENPQKNLGENTESSTTNASSEITTSPAPAVELPTFTKETLARYNGKDPSLPIYIAFEGNVYDVSAGRTYYEPGGAYDFLAGTDGTELLKYIGGDIIKRKYSVIGTYRESN